MGRPPWADRPSTPLCMRYRSEAGPRAGARGMRPCSLLGSVTASGVRGARQGAQRRGKKKLFGPDQPEDPEEGEAITQRLPPLSHLSSQLILKGHRSPTPAPQSAASGGWCPRLAARAVSSCLRGTCSWYHACFLAASAPSWS